MISQMMDKLYTREGEMVWLENVSLPNVTFAKFQPQLVCLLEITNLNIHYAGMS